MSTKIAAVFLCLIGAGVAWSQHPYSDDPGVLWRQATIYRDAWGTPHVFADNPRALAFAFGYAQAEDHLAPMLMAYRIANGRAAEVFGEGFAASDEFAIRMGHADLAADALRSADPVTRDLCEGFALGANAWWVGHPEQSPAWADGVRPADVLALLHCYLMSFAPFDHPTAWHRAPAATTGNAWAVGPSKSQSGEAILAINPHGSYTGAFSWYEAHLVCGDLNVAGATLYGLPAIMMGHNGSLGWALTPNQTDMADVYVETAPQVGGHATNINRPELDPDLLFYLSTYSDARTLYVSTPAGMEERHVRKLETARGPVVAEEGRTFFSYRVGGYYDFGTLRQLVEMGRAQNLVGFKTALGMQQLPCFHIVYADVAGNIFYLYNSKTGVKVDPTPRRPPPPPEHAANPLSGFATGRVLFDGGELFYENRRQLGPYDASPEEVESMLRTEGPEAWTTPVDAEDGLYAWGAWVPIDVLPMIENPASGYVQACGNPPWLATSDSELHPWDWPSWLVRDRDTYRAKRVRQLLERGSVSVYDCQHMLFDAVAPFALEMVPLILDAATQHPNYVATAHPDLPVTLKLLEDWNGAASADSVGMTIFHLWWSNLRNQSFPMLNSEEELYLALTAKAPGMQESILVAVNDATRMLRNAYQSVSVPWGAVHQLHRGGRTVEAPGAMSGEPILVTEDRQLEGQLWPVTYGSGFSMVVEFGETPRASSLVPFGASENPGSPHYDDQLTLFTQQRLKPMRFEVEDVERNATQAYGMNIVLRASGMVGQFRLQSTVPVAATMTSEYTAPGSLPEGLAPFTVFATAGAEPSYAAAQLAMAIHIPDVLCADAHLELLQIYRHDGEDWTPLAGQTIDVSTRMLSGVSDRAGTFAVLGPLEYRTTHVAAATETTPSESEPEYGDILARLQPTPPTSALVADTHDDGPMLVDPKTWKPVDIKIGRERGFDWPGMGAANQPAPASPLVPSDGISADTREHATRTPDATTGPVKPRIEVSWDPDAPPTIDAPGVQTSDMFRGKKIEFRPPSFDALFKIAAKRLIQAQMRVTNAPPGALPEGLVAFTDFAEIFHTKTTPIPEVAILVSIPSSKCAKVNLDRLGIYVYDAEDGWQRLPGQTYDDETSSISALDRPPRLYAVLGPAECLVR